VESSGQIIGFTRLPARTRYALPVDEDLVVNPPDRPIPSRRALLRCVACVVCAVGLAACTVEPNPNANSGPDYQKSGAREISFGRSSTDTVDRKGGDMTDWKYFRVPTTGVVELSVAFDNPKARGVALIRDALGVQIARLEHRGQPVLRATFRGEPGIYYIEIFSNEGHTSYTYDVTFQPLY
jgi:hypothetical protein